MAAYSHWSQGYLIPSCLDSLCFFKVSNVVAAKSHWLQGYLTPISLDCLLWYKEVLDPIYSHGSQEYLILVIYLVSYQTALKFTHNAFVWPLGENFKENFKKGLKYMTDKNYIDIYTYDLLSFMSLLEKLEIKKVLQT